MQTEFLLVSTPVVKQARRELVEHGYRAGAGVTFRGPIIAVEHPDAELDQVEEIVHAIDPAAQRY